MQNQYTRESPNKTEEEMEIEKKNQCIWVDPDPKKSVIFV